MNAEAATGRQRQKRRQDAGATIATVPKAADEQWDNA